MALRGRPNKIEAEHLAVLQEFVVTNPTATLAEIGAELTRRCAISAHEQTIIKALRQAGIVRVKGAHDEAPAQPKPKRYGYNESHRRQQPEQRYPSSLTDHEWELVHDLFEGHQGIPPEWPRRMLVDACCYVVRTGCSWRQLPREFGRWQNVYRTFRRWSEQASSSSCMTACASSGASGRASKSSPVQRCSMPNPPASPRKAVRVASMRARRSKAASAI